MSRSLDEAPKGMCFYFGAQRLRQKHFHRSLSAANKARVATDWSPLDKAVNMINLLHEEVSEVQSELPFKFWKPYFKPNKAKVLEELADVFLMWVNLALLLGDWLGFDHDDIDQAIKAKMDFNATREDQLAPEVDK